jgi:hypothetical protein
MTKKRMVLEIGMGTDNQRVEAELRHRGRQARALIYRAQVTICHQPALRADRPDDLSLSLREHLCPATRPVLCSGRPDTGASATVDPSEH